MSFGRILPTLLLLLCLLLLSACGSIELPPNPPRSSEPLTLWAPPSVNAGEPMLVTVEAGDMPDGTPIQLVAFGSFGSSRFVDEFYKGAAVMELSAEFTQTAGHITLFAETATQRGETSFDILPGPPAEPLVTLIGPKTLTVDQGEWAHAVLIPFDQFYNPVADGTQLTIRAARPTGAEGLYSTETRHLIAWRRIFPSLTAGRTRVASQASGTFGPEANFEETPGDPVAFGISAERDLIPADGRQLTLLRTDDLFDSYGNKLADGTLVTFVIKSDTGEQRSLPSFTIDGVAELPLQAPTLAGEESVYAIVSATVSDPITLRYIGDAVAVPIVITADADSVKVLAGPILGTLQEFLPDGLAARFIITDQNGKSQAQDGLLVDGYASSDFRTASLDAGDYTVLVLIGNDSGQTTFTVRAGEE